LIKAFTTISCAVIAAALFACRSVGHPALDTLAESAKRFGRRASTACPPEGQDVLPSTLSWGFYDTMTRLLNEPSLACGPSLEEEVYRLIWWRTFHPPISIRLGRVGPAAAITAVELKGAGGYRPGPINRLVHKDVSAVEWNAAVKTLGEADVWRAESDGPSAFGHDGSTWLLESRLGDRCHVLYRWSPRDAHTRDVALRFLELAGFTVPSEQFY
jgi:hypothetical protein